MRQLPAIPPVSLHVVTVFLGHQTRGRHHAIDARFRQVVVQPESKISRFIHRLFLAFVIPAEELLKGFPGPRDTPGEQLHVLCPNGDMPLESMQVDPDIQPFIVSWFAFVTRSPVSSHLEPPVDVFVMTVVGSPQKYHIQQ
jgi:hypothetical protein